MDNRYQGEWGEEVKTTVFPDSVDVTPKWAGLMPLLWERAAAGDCGCRQELHRIARLVDALGELPGDMPLADALTMAANWRNDQVERTCDNCGAGSELTVKRYEGDGRGDLNQDALCKDCLAT